MRFFLRIIFILFILSFFVSLSFAEEKPKLTWKIHFNVEWGWAIDITKWNDEVYSESFTNNYINKDIEISLECTSTACELDTISKAPLITENGIWSLSITDKFWRVLTKSYKIIKINKTKPVWNLIYIPDNNTRVNWERIVTLTWEAQNWDWLIWNSSPSIWCDKQWWCSWTLQLKDSAGNILSKAYNIKNIDKINPTLSKEATGIVENWKEKIIIKCTDTWWSNCIVNEQVYWIEQWTWTNKCVYDKAWNADCKSFYVDESKDKYKTDENLDWTNKSRYIWIECSDETWWSWCKSPLVWVTLTENTTYKRLVIFDRANHATGKVFQISKIDKVLPEIKIEWESNFKAWSIGKIEISSNDTLSWVKETKYKWGQSCKSWDNLLWNSVENNISISYTASWNHTLYVCSKDNAWNIKEVRKEFTIYPWDLDESQIHISVDSKWDKYANNSDFYTYTFFLKDKYWNLIYDKDIKSLKQITDSNYFSLGSLNNTNWKITFHLKSLYPFKSFKQLFKISIEKWNDNYINNWEIQNITKAILENNSFKKPLIWEFEVIEWWTISEIWKEQKYKIQINNPWNLTSYSLWEINISQSTIKNNIAWHIWNWNFSEIEKKFWSDLTNYLWFIWKIDANDNILKSPVIKSNNLKISYRLEWKDIEYSLDNFTSVWSCDLETLWLKIIWTLQWDWKLETIANWNLNNFSDLSKWKIRSIIRKNAYTSIRNRESSKTKNINNVIYFKGDNITYWEVKNYLKENDTIIVKDWNLIIDEDINKNIWIIIIKDNYNVEDDYKISWNIYVKNNVSNINAIIYADWVFRSAKLNWKVLESYSDSELNKQLNLYWSLFTRNTIGWAVKASLSYTLPGWKTTNSFDLAQIYDLNYTRKVPKTCDWNDKNDYSFIIKYNPSIQSNPPKLFGQ
jgi:hypothetical protein